MVNPSIPCPVPKGWVEAANWNLTESTICQPAGMASGPGYFVTPDPWGLVSLDWSVAQSHWNPTGNNTAVSVENCRLLKAQGVIKRCFIYHNLALSLEWLEWQREAMYDESKSDYFLQYTDGMGNKNGTIYN